MQSNDKIRNTKVYPYKRTAFDKKCELSKRANGGVLKRKEDVVTYLIKELSTENLRKNNNSNHICLPILW
jgi:hypothetical protein